jgi:hypothetical protein
MLGKLSIIGAVAAPRPVIAHASIHHHQSTLQQRRYL